MKEALVMRIAKTIAILFAMVLVVMCFNAPIVHSGEEHPWDGDGSGDGLGDGIDGFKGDTTIVDPLTDENKETSGYNPDDFGLYNFLMNLQFLFWYHDIPGVVSENNGVSGSAN